jgi:hypothetical protein
MRVNLERQEWEQVLTWIGSKTFWAECNPLMSKIVSQLQNQVSGNSRMQEVPAAEEHPESKAH